MDLPTYLAYVAACIAVVAVPGPSVTLIIANSMRHGTRAGLATVLGTQLGLAVLLAVLAGGLASVVASASVVFDVVRWVGAAYLVFLGVQMWRSGGRLGAMDAAPPPRRGFVLEAFLVLLANPKALLFFGAFIPQFVDPSGNVLAQTLALGATFIAVAIVLDGAYALAAGRAGGLLTRGNVRLVERLSGSFLIAGGIWLVMARRA
ncbi:MAG: LysE family translocator [Rhizobiales bacterium]|nr:LysE family translocator [Hyphomicrobiales bacterium]